MDIKTLIEERKNYPVNSKTRNKNEEEYVKEKLSNDPDVINFVFPAIFLHSYKYREQREIIFKQYHTKALLDLSSIWKPYTSVQFQLLSVAKEKPKKVTFSKYVSDKTFNAPDPRAVTGVIGVQNIENEYQEYLEKMNELLKGKFIPSLTTKNYKFWQVKYDKVEMDRLIINYYDPENTESVKKLKQEETIPLGELSDILKPRKVENSEGLVIKTKDFAYPLYYENLSRESETNVNLKKGDILLSYSYSGKQKYHLIDKDPEQNLYASTFLTVIRPTGNTVDPAYLFLYLQSDTAEKYVKMFSVGTAFKRLRRADLENFPIVIPDSFTQNKSQQIFKTLFYKDKDNLIQSINKQLFEEKTPSKPVQEEFIFEELQKLQFFKKEVIERVLEDDLRELNLTKQHKLYKSFLILAGSVLEAFLLDWVSELENKDYFSPSEKQLGLYKLIWKKLKVAIPNIDEQLLKKADEIRKKRNLIHPRAYFNSDLSIDQETCDEIISDLKLIFNSRR